jgi:Tfp pilus assembly protein FimT
MAHKPRNSSDGFSLIELLAVCGLTLVIAAYAVPKTMTAMYNLRLRAGAVSAAEIFQNGRMLAIKQNRKMDVHFVNSSGTVSVYVDSVTVNSQKDTGEPSATMNGSPTMMYTPTGTGAPSALTDAKLGFNLLPSPTITDVSFNSRGLPCAGSCTSISGGFVYYFSDSRPWGKPGWAAISITPAGRIKVWTWSGTAWN